MALHRTLLMKTKINPVYYRAGYYPFIAVCAYYSTKIYLQIISYPLLTGMKISAL